jgi:hypothetical protein
MLQPMSHAWHLVSKGDFNAAEHTFQGHLNQNNASVEALRGLARVALSRGQHQEAESLARRGLGIDETADLQLLMGEILGAQGRRREAEQHLKRAVQFHSSDSYGWALLGEQKIRQGRWEEGTNDFIDALSDDADGDGFRHAKKVISDLIDAYIAGRLPEQEAMKFINRLDYSVPKTGPEMQSFFGKARRAVNSGQSMTVRQEEHETLPSSVRSAARRSNGSTRQTAGGPSGSPARREQPPRASRPPAPPRSPRQTDTSNANTGQADASQSSARQSSRKRPGVDAKQQDVQALIQRERSLNQDLLSGIAEMGPPEWPSLDSNNIDDVAPISLDRGSVLGETIGIDTRDFRVTSGDILAEIFLERCLRRLLVATQKTKATPIILRPESIWQMELNCRDGVLQELSPLSPLYKDRPSFEDFRVLALGSFLGECLIKAYDGTWSFETPASNSYLEIGAKILQPFDLASRWIAAEDKDDVSLSELAKEAKRASEASTSLTIPSDYIDPTRELSDAALATKLAELWSLYRFALSDAALSKVAETIEVISVEDAAIVFKIGKRWVPDFARGPENAGVLDDETVAMAYLRGTGDFVPLASREGFSRLLATTGETLDRDTAERALGWLKKYHRPGWWVASNDAAAAKLSKRVGRSLNSPQIEHQQTGSALVVDGVSTDGPVQWTLVFDSRALMQWQLKVES